MTTPSSPAQVPGGDVGPTTYEEALMGGLRPWAAWVLSTTTRLPPFPWARHQIALRVMKLTLGRYRRFPEDRFL